MVVSITLCLICCGICYGYYGAWRYILWHKSLSVSEAKKAQYLLKEPDKLIKRIEKALLINPDDHQGWYLLGRLYIAKQNDTKAMFCMQRAYSIKKKARYKEVIMALDKLQSSVELDKG